MGTCCSCGHKNKVSPLEDSLPKKVTGNFIRGRGDGESDVSDVEKGKSSMRLDRHVSGSSFSSDSCASRSVDELNINDEDDILAHFSKVRRHELLSRFDVMSEVNSEVKTEGGLTDVALDLDHPFAPLYEGDELNEAMLSRPRSVGMRGRSSYARDILSQLSNYSELDYPVDGPKREDTPVPGKRGGSNIGSKRKGKKRGNISSRSKRSQSNLQREETDLCSATPRSQRSDTPGAFSTGSMFSVKSDDGGDSLCSSTASLSAIGEISENGSSAQSGARKTNNNKFAKANSMSSPLPAKQPRLQTNGSKKENVPPRPPPRPSKRNPNTPRSADLLNPAEKESLPEPPKSADMLLGSRQNSMIRPDTVEHMQTNSYKPEVTPKRRPGSMMQSIDVSLATYNRGSIEPTPAERKSFIRRQQVKLDSPKSGRSRKGYNPTFLQSSPSLQDSPTSGRSRMGYNQMFSEPPAFSNAWNIGQFPPKMECVKPNEKPAIIPRNKPASALYHNRSMAVEPEVIEKPDVLNERPMAARPRRPATAIESYPMDVQQLKLKLPNMMASDDMYSDESMDDESHPDKPRDDRFKTIIII